MNKKSDQHLIGAPAGVATANNSVVEAAGVSTANAGPSEGEGEGSASDLGDADWRKFADLMLKFTGMTPDELLADMREHTGEQAATASDAPEEVPPVEVPTEMLYFPCTLAVECSRGLDDVFGARVIFEDPDPVVKRFAAASAEAVGVEMAEPTQVVEMMGDHFKTSWEVNGYTVSIERSPATNDKIVFEIDLGL